jgi:hypothetical protein
VTKEHPCHFFVYGWVNIAEGMAAHPSGNTMQSIGFSKHGTPKE